MAHQQTPPNPYIDASPQELWFEMSRLYRALDDQTPRTPDERRALVQRTKHLLLALMMEFDVARQLGYPTAEISGGSMAERLLQLYDARAAQSERLHRQQIGRFAAEYALGDQAQRWIHGKFVAKGLAPYRGAGDRAELQLLLEGLADHMDRAGRLPGYDGFAVKSRSTEPASS